RARTDRDADRFPRRLRSADGRARRSLRRRHRAPRRRRRRPPLRRRDRGAPPRRREHRGMKASRSRAAGEAMNAVSSTSESHPRARARPGRRIFLVDNDERTTRRLAKMLEEDGYAVEVFADGRDAIARLERGPAPDAIITDLVMPHASGIAVLGEA